MYTRAFSTLGCPEFSLDESIALARRHGITQLELRALGGSLDVPKYLSALGNSPAELAKQIADQPVQIVALDTSFRVIDGTAADRITLLDYVPWAEALGIRWLRVFDGGKSLDEASLAAAAENLAWWNAVRRERGLKVDWMIETHDVLINTPKIQRFFAAMPPNTAHLLWDTHHTWKKGGEDPFATWRQIAPQVVHVHVKDSVSVPSEKHPFTYVPPGAGEFPMNSVRPVLAAEFSGAISLEWEKLWHPYLQPLDVGLRSAAERAWW
jgi:sugar phosphate isomerase/epimerase